MGQAVQAVFYSPPPGPGLRTGSVISQFLLHHKLGTFSHKHYYSQTVMFTFKVKFGYFCPRGWGQAVQVGLSCPPPSIGSGSVISQFLLHHNLGIFSCKRNKRSYVISVKQRCLHPAFSSVTFVRGMGAICPSRFILLLAQELGQAVSPINYDCTIILEYLVV